MYHRAGMGAAVGGGGGDYRHINVVDQLFGSETATAQLRCGVHRPRCDDDASPVD